MQQNSLYPENHPVESEEEYIVANSGDLLDPSWYNSSFWKFGGTSAQMLIFDDSLVVGIAAYEKLATQSCVHDLFAVGSGYRLFAVDCAAKDNPTRSKPGTGE